MNKKLTFTLGTAAIGLMALTGCASNAEKANHNLSTAADNFEVQRRIVGVNTITDKILFEVEGRCSINDQDIQLEIICKHGPDDFRKHMIGKADNSLYIATQLDPVKVSEYHTRIILKPENLIPNFDLQTK